jgi:hypothetical protein
MKNCWRKGYKISLANKKPGVKVFLFLISNWEVYFRELFNQPKLDWNQPL